MADQRPLPFRLRFRVILTVIPPLVGIAVGIPLWNEDAGSEFFSAASHVLAIGSVGLALTGRFFRLAIHREAGAAGFYAIFNVLGVLIFTGIGLFFCFKALVEGTRAPGTSRSWAAHSPRASPPSAFRRCSGPRASSTRPTRCLSRTRRSCRPHRLATA